MPTENAFRPQVDRSLRYLSSPAALESTARNAYWPKWDSPWWHALLLFEMGLAQEIPKSILLALANSVDQGCLHFFPVREEELPKGTDPHAGIPCHCQLGTFFQLLHAANIDPDETLPWVRPWFLRYQLPDGGLNCDEQVYTRAEPHSSFLSTLPPLEAVLRCTDRAFTTEEVAFLDTGAAYLIARRLMRGARSGEVIDADWLKPCFPRYYHYDVLRGLDWLTEWALKLQRELPRAAVAEAAVVIEANAAPSGGVRVERRPTESERSVFFENGVKTLGPASRFALLDEVSAAGQSSPWLTRNWETARQRLAQLDAAGLLI